MNDMNSKLNKRAGHAKSAEVNQQQINTLTPMRINNASTIEEVDVAVNHNLNVLDQLVQKRGRSMHPNIMANKSGNQFSSTTNLESEAIANHPTKTQEIIEGPNEGLSQNQSKMNQRTNLSVGQKSPRQSQGVLPDINASQPYYNKVEKNINNVLQKQEPKNTLPSVNSIAFASAPSTYKQLQKSNHNRQSTAVKKVPDRNVQEGQYQEHVESVQRNNMERHSSLPPIKNTSANSNKDHSQFNLPSRYKGNKTIDSPEHGKSTFIYKNGNKEFFVNNKGIHFPKIIKAPASSHMII